MEREHLRLLKDAVRSLDFVDERIFEETTTLDAAWEAARFDGKALDVERVRRVRDALPSLMSALEGAMTSIDLALDAHEREML